MKNTLVRVLAVVLLVQSGCALCVLHSVTTDELPATMSESSNGRQVKAGNRATVRIEKGKVTGCTVHPSGDTGRGCRATLQQRQQPTKWTHSLASPNKKDHPCWATTALAAGTGTTLTGVTLMQHFSVRCFNQSLLFTVKLKQMLSSFSFSLLEIAL